MKKTTIVAFAISLLAVLAITPSLQVFAQAPEMSEEKRAAYAKYYEKNKGTPDDQKVAYQLAQEFVQKYGADDDTYVKAAKRFIVKYEKMLRMLEFDQAIAQKDYAKAFDAGQKVLADEPENFKVIINLASAGQQSAKGGNTSLNAQTLNYARQAVQLLEANKVTDTAGMTPADALGFAYSVQGTLQLQSAPKEAAAVFAKAAKTTGAYKDDPGTFFYLGSSILNGEYQEASEKYKLEYGGKDETEASKEAFAKLNAISQRGIDAMARAVALATKPEHAGLKKSVMKELTDVYKDLNKGSTEGLDALIASVLSKPMP